MTALLPAFLLESAFYLACLFDQTRKLLGQFRPIRLQAAILLLSAVLPYLVFSLSAGTFQRNAFYLLVGLSALFSFWHVILPRRVAYDFGFLILAAAPIVARAFGRVYQTPGHEIRADILGHLMWIRVGVVALLLFREWDAGAFGMWPTAREWRMGAIYYCAAIVPLTVVGLITHDVRWEPQTGWRALGLAAVTFFGFLWVTALGEELFFRGVITRTLLNHLPSRALAITASAILFGCAHFWFKPFPDWRSALVAAVLGVFCGTAYLQSGGVRAPMVMHSLVVMTWRVFFK